MACVCALVAVVAAALAAVLGAALAAGKDNERATAHASDRRVNAYFMEQHLDVEFACIAQLSQARGQQAYAQRAKKGITNGCRQSFDSPYELALRHAKTMP